MTIEPLSDEENIARRIPGHSCSELADIFGGYLCECERSSWIRLDGYPYGGGCYEVRADVRQVLAAMNEIQQEWADLG
jgi:hypothetical protein